jgi:serine/threonine protein kinase
MPQPPPTDSTTPNGGQTSSFGNYRVQELIGQGSFATVYRAELRGEFGFRKEVALKVLHKTAQDFAERETMEFLREARLGAYIRHPNLVEFYECGRVHDRLYIAMELVRGPNLSQLMRLLPDRSDRLDARAILVVAQQTARGLQALHEATIKDQHIEAVHRDLKPANILIGTQGQAKIADYGITRFAADFYRTAGVEEIRGSPLYMAPEQAVGETPTQASDVFSFGGIVLSLLVGHPIFEARSLEEVLERVRDAEVGPALSLGRQRAPDLVDVLQVCLEVDPDARYPNGTALMRALRKLDPPPFGEEYVADLARWGEERLDDRRSLGHIERSEDGPLGAADTIERDLPFDLDEDLLPLNTPLSLDDEDTVDTTPWDAIAPAGKLVRRTRFLVWALVILCLGFAATQVVTTLRAAFRPPPATRYTLVEDREARTETPADPVTEPIEAATEGIAGGEPDEAITEAAPPDPAPRTVRLHHTPVTREIRGEPIQCGVRVDPPGSYRATIRYRGSRWDPWQYSSTTTQPDGTAVLVVPYGAWFTENATVVEYFIEIQGPSGPLRSGTSEHPHEVRLH